MHLPIPDEVVHMHLTSGGDAGRAWLEALPGRVDALCARWQLRVGSPYLGGCVGFVVPAERPNGERVVLKVSPVDDETRHEADALAFWDGRGAVRLLDADPAHGALLLERLSPGTSLAEHPDQNQAIDLACGLLLELWRPAPPSHPFFLVSALAERWSRELPERFHALSVPFEGALVREATRLCEDLAASQRHLVVCNRDFHLGNVLSAERAPWLLIDPKPLVGERAFDLGHLVRTLLPASLDRGAVDALVVRLSRALDLDPDRVRAWVFVRSVDDALWNIETAHQSPARDLAIAQLLA